MFDLKDAIETLRLQTKVMAEQNLGVYPLDQQHAIKSTDWTKEEVLACLGMHAAQLDKRKITGMAYDLRVVMAWVEAQS
jgi:hypothetical protein